MVSPARRTYDTYGQRSSLTSEAKISGARKFTEMQPSPLLDSMTIAPPNSIRVAASHDYRRRLQCKIVQEFADLELTSNAWDELLGISDFNDIFSSYGFKQAWWRAFGSSKRLHLVIVEDAETTPKLIAPLYFENVESKTLRVVGDLRGDYSNLVFKKGDHDSLGRFFSWLRTRNGWRSLRLAKLPAESAIHSHFPVICGANDSRMNRLRCWM